MASSFWICVAQCMMVLITEGTILEDEHGFRRGVWRTPKFYFGQEVCLMFFQVMLLKMSLVIQFG